MPNEVFGAWKIQRSPHSNIVQFECKPSARSVYEIAMNMELSADLNDFVTERQDGFSAKNRPGGRFTKNLPDDSLAPHMNRRLKEGVHAVSLCVKAEARNE